MATPNDSSFDDPHNDARCHAPILSDASMPPGRNEKPPIPLDGSGHMDLSASRPSAPSVPSGGHDDGVVFPPTQASSQVPLPSRFGFGPAAGPQVTASQMSDGSLTEQSANMFLPRATSHPVTAFNAPNHSTTPRRWVHDHRSYLASHPSPAFNTPNPSTTPLHWEHDHRSSSALEQHPTISSTQSRVPLLSDPMNSPTDNNYFLAVLSFYARTGTEHIQYTISAIIPPSDRSSSRYTPISRTATRWGSLWSDTLCPRSPYSSHGSSTCVIQPR